MKAFILVMLGLRLLLLTGAVGMCVYGLFATGDNPVPWTWRAGYALGLGLSAFLWIHVWKASVKTWRE
ncbi:MAG: hypothetical protein ACKOLZ_02170 [Verrucomicrobiota bacterium]